MRNAGKGGGRGGVIGALLLVIQSWRQRCMLGGGWLAVK
jgi:hypothetical protein